VSLRSQPQTAFRDRYTVLQPNLDTSVWRFWGQLPGYDGRVFAKALQERGDQFRSLPETVPTSQSQRNADALVAMAQDSLCGPSPNGNGLDHAERAPVVTVFVDATLATPTKGAAGAEIAFGPRVGPETLQRILCEGSVELVGLDRGRPVVASATTRAIPPAIRRFDPDNLTTVCWYHHHVAIHWNGFRIDPHSPPQRRRLIPPEPGPDPPAIPS
jgi:hypothetical protein